MDVNKILEAIKYRMGRNADPSYNAYTYKLCEAFSTLYITGLVSPQTYAENKNVVNEIRIEIFSKFSNSEEFRKLL